jgi:outer membrane cobalamin receptor
VPTTEHEVREAGAIVAALRIRGYLVGLLAASPAFAQTPAPPDDLETLVVTGSREPRPLAEAPASVTVITREEIAAGAYTSLAEMLRFVAGAHLDQPGSRGSRASLYTRGLDPNLTIVMIDGVRVNDPTNARGGSFDFSTLDPASIERIEIVRGPVSAVHGSDGLAGGVNIITRQGEAEPEIRLDASGGRWGVHRIAGEARGGHGPFDAALGGGWVDEGEPPGKGRFRGGNLKADLGIELPGGARLRTALRWSDTHSEAYPELSGGPERAVLRQVEKRDSDALSAGVSLTVDLTEWLDAAIQGGYYRVRNREDSPGIAPGVLDPIPPSRTRDAYDSGKITLRTTARPLEGLSVALGGDVFHEDGSSRGALFPDEAFAIPTSFDLDRWVGGPFGEVHWRGYGLTLYAGLRADFPDSDEAEVTPRVSARYLVPRIDVTLSGSWGRGFKLPSFFALAHPVVGNPALVAEESHGWDVGIERSFWEGRIHGRVTWFDIDVKNLVDFDPGPPPQLVNRSKVRSRGVEMEWVVQPLDTLDLGGNATWTDADILGSPAELLNRPRWRASVAALWTPFPPLMLRASLLYVGEVEATSNPTGQRTLGDWARVDVAAFWRVLEDLTLYLQVENLFDADYQEAVGFPSQGIRPRAGVTWRLGRSGHSGRASRHREDRPAGGAASVRGVSQRSPGSGPSRATGPGPQWAHAPALPRLGSGRPRHGVSLPW